MAYLANRISSHQIDKFFSFAQTFNLKNVCTPNCYVKGYLELCLQNILMKVRTEIADRRGAITISMPRLFSISRDDVKLLFTSQKENQESSPISDVAVDQ